jgi:hypothetical protein
MPTAGSASSSLSQYARTFETSTFAGTNSSSKHQVVHLEHTIADHDLNSGSA